MTKAQLQTAVEAKKGFKSIIEDKVAPDNISGDPIEKRFFHVNHTNGDGTAGKTFLYYLHDTKNDEAWFYNVETESVDSKEPNADQKKLTALEAYLKVNFDAYFSIRADLVNNWTEADVFKLTAGKLVSSKVMVFKKGSSPISHLTIV